ncbi:DUF4910 domain-containing protein [Candidatus Neomarinimicrobiota bacterium]
MRIHAYLLICVSALSLTSAQDLLDPQIRDLLHEALSGETAKEHVIAISRYHRIQGSREYRESAQYVLDQLQQAGFSKKEAYVESYKSDGLKHYQTWQSPSGWDIDRAELRMVEPYDRRIIGYPEIAMSLITYSNPGDATAELVWVGAGISDSDYAGKDVKGKFVLATGYGGSIHRLAVLKYGAVGVVAYLDDYRATDHPDMLQYTGMWPLSDELKRVKFGFNLTNRQGEELRQLLERGEKVVLHGSVEGRGLEPYEMDVPVAEIRGAKYSDQEILFSAHLDHPKESANDNASGSAALLDIALTVNRLIDEGRMPRPDRTLRFIWVPEWYGTMAYIDKHPEIVGPELGGNILANLNMDMVGENLELLHSYLTITRTPDSMSSVLNDVMADMAGMVADMNIRTPRGSQSQMNYRITPYSGGSDHMMFIDRKIPSTMFSHHDYTHHTSEDTPDKVDPVELERSEIIATGVALYLANLSDDEAVELVWLAAARANGRLGNAMHKAQQTITGGEPNFEAHNILDQALMQELQVVESVTYFNSSPNVKKAVELASNALQAYATTARACLPTPDAVADIDGRIPKRLTRGPLDFGLPEDKLTGARLAWYGSEEFTLGANQRFELVNFIDGKHTVNEIRNMLSAEFTPVDEAVVMRYIEDLVGVGVIGWK